MPSKSPKQHRFFEMVAHDPKAAKRVGVPQSVGKEFVSADKGKKFNKGGEMKSKPDLKKLFKLCSFCALLTCSNNVKMCDVRGI